MKKTKILYWVFTALFAAAMLFSAIPDILSSADAIHFMNLLGYPLYFAPFIGIAKTLGVIAILIPGYPRIKEWAYAGLFFDLAGAFYSIAATVNVAAALPLLIFILLGVCSYVFYHKLRKETLLTEVNK